MCPLKTVRVLFLGSVLAMGTTGCADRGDDVIAHFESEAKTAGYSCVETVPPIDGMLAMRTCRGESGEELQFALFDTEESLRSWGDIVPAGEDPTSISHSTWIIAGEAEEVVQYIASELGAETEQN